MIWSASIHEDGAISFDLDPACLWVETRCLRVDTCLSTKSRRLEYENITTGRRGVGGDACTRGKGGGRGYGEACEA